MDIAMLLEYGFRNFLSFKEGTTVSFRLDGNCPLSISNGKSTTPVLCVKGANGSGKTQLLKALAFISDFAARSFSRGPEDPLRLDSFYGNPNPSEFYVDFCVKDESYRYEASITSSEVKSESLYRTKQKRAKIVERVGNEIVYTTKPLSKLKTLKLRKNASFISTAHQYELSELTIVHNFFNQILSNVSYSGVREKLQDLTILSKGLKSSPKTFAFVKAFIRDCDIGITDIKIGEEKSQEGIERYYPIFFHSTNDKDVPVLPFSESSGTKQLFRWLSAYKLTLDRGSLLILDEFDIYLHAHILPKLLELFLNDETNPNGAQLLFSTHNSEVLDFLGRYRTYLVNKIDNESFSYRLDEIPGDILRNDRPILPAYEAGKIGGVPKL